MFNKATRISLIFASVIFMINCTPKTENKDHLVLEIETIKKEYAPDKRVALFNVNAEKMGDNYILKGESNLPEAVTALKNSLQEFQLQFTDSIQLLPASDLENKIMGLVTISVANLRSEPKHSGELATQATLGTPVKIYKKEGS